VSRVAAEAGGAMYEAAQAASAASGPSAGEGGTGDSADDTVVDAEVVDEGPAEEQK
jgi:molecular chaperone DnaK